ncbi:MAG: hypothetical protein IJ277_00085 [Bacteroidaceae bacterium]|nr:hypothetical protein [Bacteroidaceae bacterium]
MQIIALILGTGGVSKAVAYSLTQMDIEYIFVSRNASEKAIAYEQLTKEIMRTHTLIINCTPLGMVGHGIDQCPAIPYKQLNESHLLYDIVYNPETPCSCKKEQRRAPPPRAGTKCGTCRRWPRGRFGTDNCQMPFYKST